MVLCSIFQIMGRPKERVTQKERQKDDFLMEIVNFVENMGTGRMFAEHSLLISRAGVTQKPP